MNHMTRCCAALAFWALLAGGAGAQQPEKIQGTVNQSITTRKETQHSAAEWHAEKERIKSRYFQLQDAIDALEVEHTHMQDVVGRQVAFIERMETRIVEMEKIRQHLVPYLEQIIDRLETAIAKDLPFLRNERSARLTVLRQMIQDPEISMAEKLRRVYEGLRVEMDYGRSVETVKEEIDLNGEQRVVKVLRLGRTALMMLTLDEKQAGIFHNGAWHSVRGASRGEIKKAIEITERRRPIEFVKLPVKGNE
jgi:hypothetical protein